MIRKRVVLSGRSSMLLASFSRPYSSAAISPAIAAAPGFSRTARRLGIAGNGNTLNTVAMCIQPLPALGERLLMGIDAGNFLILVLRRYQQMMMNAKLHLTADFQRRRHEHIQGVIDHTLSGILHRHHTVMRRTGLHLAEYRINRRQRHADDRVAEVFERR